MAATNVGIGRKVVDITLQSIAAKGAENSNFNGTNGNVIQTANSVGTSAVARGYVWDITYLRLFPGVFAAGVTPPDLQMWVQIDRQSYQSWFFIDLSQDGNIFPRRENTVGGKWIKVGESMLAWAALLARGKRKAPPSNMPLVFTGWKVSQGVQVFFTSTSGFTAADVVEAPRIEMYGDVYDATTLQFVASNLPYTPAMSIQSERKIREGAPPYTNTFQLKPLSLSNWKSYPGGPNQGTAQVQFYAKFCSPIQAITGPQPVPLSDIPSLGGNSGIAPSTEYLGWDYADNSNDLQVIRLFGRRPGPGAGYFSLTKGQNQLFPLDTAFGATCTYGDNPIPYGAVQPYRPESNLWFLPPRWGSWDPSLEGEETIYNETMAVAIGAQEGQTIAAGTDKTVVVGVQVISTSI